MTIDAQTLRGWLHAARHACDMRAEEIPWSRSREWRFEDGRLRHAGGTFFSVVGAAVHVRGERLRRFDQPLIDQPEVGILGFLVRRGADGTEILVQAKPEPGNPGFVQAAPTVQATESNYRRRHGGKATPHLEHFLAPERSLRSSLQSEQGTRFLAKYNRNTVVALPEGANVAEGGAYRWCPAREMAALLLADLEVNTDARSVLATGPWELLAGGDGPFARWRGLGGLGETLLLSCEADAPTEPVLARLARLRAAADFETRLVDLAALDGWEITETGIGGKGFSVRPFAVSCTEREVTRWDQPLVASGDEGRVVLLCREEDGALRFLFRARAEIGFRERLQLGPTVQEPGDACLPVSPVGDEGRILLSARQSEEGGRFFRCVNRYEIRLVGEIQAADDLFPLTLGQVRRMIARPGVFTNEARSLVSMLLAYA